MAPTNGLFTFACKLVGLSDCFVSWSLTAMSKCWVPLKRYSWHLRGTQLSYDLLLPYWVLLELSLSASLSYLTAHSSSLALGLLLYTQGSPSFLPPLLPIPPIPSLFFRTCRTALSRGPITATLDGTQGPHNCHTRWGSRLVQQQPETGAAPEKGKTRFCSGLNILGPGEWHY